MDRDDQPAGGIEWLGVDDGAEVLDTAPPRRHRWPRWTPLVLLLVAGVVVALLVMQDDPGTPAAAASGPTRSVRASTTTARTTAAPSHVITQVVTPVIPSFGAPPSAPPSVVRVGHPVLGITAGYELDARGPDTVVRIQFATGRISTTGVPALQSGGPVSFMVGAHAVIVRPLDGVAGFAVPDGGSARRLTGLLAQASRLFPAADPARVWVEEIPSERDSLRLINFDGSATSTRIRLPAGFYVLGPDGAGYVLASGPGGVYDARPSGLTRITHGAVLAVGPSGWLARECDRHARCTGVYIERAGGARHRIAIDPGAVGGTFGGVIAPDGSAAAVFVGGTGGEGARTTVHLLDLTSGADRTLSLTVGNGTDTRQLAWSPDSRWLFCATDGGLHAIDMRTHRMHAVSGLPDGLSVNQIAIRSARMEP